MYTTHKRQRLISFIAWLISFHVLLLYGLPPGLFLLLAIGLLVFYLRTGVLPAVTATISLAAITAAYAAAIALSDFETKIYYRPHEMLVTYDYAANHRAYQKDAEVEMTMPFGDLQSMTPEKIAVPRSVVFRTDSDGFRNDKPYHGQEYVLVGDSFVVGVGDTQADTLNAQLLRDYGIDTYNLGQPGDLGDYLEYVRAFRERHGDRAKLIVFLFEGNDFGATVEKPKKRRYSSFALFWKRYYNLFSGTAVFRVTKSLYKRARRAKEIAQSENVAIHDVAGVRMGFYKPYMAESRKPEYNPDRSVEAAILELAKSSQRIYFVPTKYRVYHEQLTPGEDLPHAHWAYLDALCKRHRLACTDLTDPLVRAAEERLREGQTIWWPDDTHWNRYGIEVAAKIVATQLRMGSAPL